MGDGDGGAWLFIAKPERNPILGEQDNPILHGYDFCRGKNTPFQFRSPELLPSNLPEEMK